MAAVTGGPGSRRSRWPGAWCGCALAVPMAVAAQQPVYRAEVEMVLLHVAVVDPGGAPVPLLERDDFRVYEDGVRQRIALFSTPSEASLDVALLVDSSTSMTPVAVTARRAARTFLDLLEPGDCVYVLPFDETVGPGRWGRAADPVLRAFIGGIEVGGGTALYDALLAGLGALERLPAEEVGAASPPSSTPGGDSPSSVRCGGPLPPLDPSDPSTARRRSLVVLSDGADEDSEATFRQVLETARRASVPIFPVSLGVANADPELRAGLGELARATGGRLIESLRPDRLRRAYTEVVALLRASYLLGYYPGRGGTTAPPPSRGGRLTWHEVRVELRRPNFQVLVRPGYYREGV